MENDWEVIWNSIHQNSAWWPNFLKIWFSRPPCEIRVDSIPNEFLISIHFSEFKNNDFETSYAKFCEIAQNKKFQYFDYNSVEN